MKKIFRRVAIYTFILFIIPQFIPGLKIHGGIFTLFLGGLGLTLAFMFLRPILNIISFPINFLTLGLFSMIINAALLYGVTRFINQISIMSFILKPIHFLTYSTPAVGFNQITAYIVIAFIISFLESMLFLLVG